MASDDGVDGFDDAAGEALIRYRLQAVSGVALAFTREFGEYDGHEVQAVIVGGLELDLVGLYCGRRGEEVGHHGAGFVEDGVFPADLAPGIGEGCKGVRGAWPAEDEETLAEVALGGKAGFYGVSTGHVASDAALPNKAGGLAEVAGKGAVVDFAELAHDLDEDITMLGKHSGEILELPDGGIAGLH